MIKFDVESPIECKTCGQLSTRRTIEASYGSMGSRLVAYDTHSRGLTEKENLAKLGQLDKFYEQLYQLQLELNAFPPDDLKLSNGSIVEFDLETVHPDACNIRENIVPFVRIRAFGLFESVRLPARPLKKQTAGSLLKEARQATIPVLIRLKNRFDNGDF